MNPKNVALARTARLAREATSPVYTTVTPAPVREHVTMVEIESDMGGRHWAGPFYSASAQSAAITDYEGIGYWLSDIDCSMKCWCVKEGSYGE